MDVCKNYRRNMERCPCPSEDCANKGYCCDCVARHRAKGNLPVCLRGDEAPEDVSCALT